MQNTISYRWIFIFLTPKIGTRYSFFLLFFLTLWYFFLFYWKAWIMMIVSVFHIHAFIINKVFFVYNMYHLQSANCKFLFFFLFQDATLPPKWIAFRTIIFNEKVCVYWIWITNLLPWQKKKGSYAQCTLKFGDLYLTFIIRFWFLKYDAWYPSLSLIFFYAMWPEVWTKYCMSYVKFCTARKMASMIQKELLHLILMVVLWIHLWKGMKYK